MINLDNLDKEMFDWLVPSHNRIYVPRPPKLSIIPSFNRMTLNAALGKYLTKGDRIDVGISKDGQYVAINPNDKGAYIVRGDKYKTVTCHEIIDKLEALGLVAPTKYFMELSKIENMLVGARLGN